MIDKSSSGESLAYAHPEVLVDIQWVMDHLNNPRVRIVEVNYDPNSNYVIAHIPGAVLIDWGRDISDPLSKNILTKEACEKLLQNMGVNNDTTLVLYSDFGNLFATFAFWVFKYYGFQDVRLINGGRRKWLEEGLPLSTEIPTYPRGNFRASEPDKSIRVLMPYVKGVLGSPDKILVDVRSPEEYTGEVVAPPEYPAEHAMRGGHIPGAINIPWNKVLNRDGTFKSADDLKKLFDSMAITSNKEVITYCRIGERSSHMWFVLKYLLGYPNVKSYDGSWMEWGNVIGNPIEK
jgi:thiosulfate/3-mercaptopyruvate sulfurtransferase